MKTTSSNFYRERIDAAEHFIQKNLDRDFSLEEVAQAAYFSMYHFHRLFSIYAGEGVYSYAKRLRLQRAAERLCLSSKSINEIAREALYQSTSSFTKAFSAYFGIAPARYRIEKKQQLHEKFENEPVCQALEWPEVQPRFEEIDSFEVLCTRCQGSCLEAGYSAWKKLEEEVRVRGYDWSTLRYFGVTVDLPDITDDTRVRYDAGVNVVSFPLIQNSLFRATFGGGHYAVFLHTGPYETLWQTYLGICLGWLPSSDEVLRDAPWFDEYLNRPEYSDPQNLKTLIHVPLI